MISPTEVYGLESLREEALQLGKPVWRPMLEYVAQLHERCIHPPCKYLPYPWEEIGPGYCYGPAFGHWDLIHAVLDVVPVEQEHAYWQMLNYFANQQGNGLIPGSLWLNGTLQVWDRQAGHPPVWVVAVDRYNGSSKYALLQVSYTVLQRQIQWFETHRQSVDGIGFFYQDIVNRTWESGIDDGVRFVDAPHDPRACVDATSHLYLLYETASRWADMLGFDTFQYIHKMEQLREYIQSQLYSSETGYFHDSWSVKNPAMRCLTIEGFWPMVVGAATQQQAMSVIHDNLLNPQKFFTPHPLASLAVCDPRFEMRMWRGPAWNSMTYWAALGCVRYGQYEAANMLLEQAVDASAEQYKQTGTIWEFYHPYAESPELLQRKPTSKFNKPCPDYLGHNPMLAMARLYDSKFG